MIVYGWNSKVLKESPFPNHNCASCDSTDSHVVVSASYAHVFWIPIFPYKKQLTIVCENCDLETKPKDVSEEVRQFAKKLKSTVKFPIYMFAGSGVLGLLIAWLVITGFMNSQKTEEYLQAPQTNDIYFLYDKTDLTEYKHYLWKVTDVKGDSVYVTFNSFHYTRKPIRLDAEDGFYAFSMPFHKTYIKELYDKDELRSIQRGFEPGRGFDQEVELTQEDIQDLAKTLTEAAEGN